MGRSVENVYIALSLDSPNAYHGSCAEDLLEDIINENGEVSPEWDFYLITKSERLKLSLEVSDG